MTVRDLQRSFAAWRDERKPLVLASVWDTRGSTYSKTGARMLISGDGNFQGMLSGGCLEGDLAERALAVLSSGAPQSVTYDLGKNDEELWGLGVGCDGLMRIFLQPLLPESEYQPFAAIAEVLAGDSPGVAATVLDSGTAALPPGASLVLRNGDVLTFGIPDAAHETILGECHAAAAGKASYTRSLEIDGNSVSVLFARVMPPPRVLILGAGLDAEPVLRLTTELGWRATVQDHRPSYVERGDFRTAEEVLCRPAAELAGSIELERYDAAIVMSHHLATDRTYLTLLADSSIPYIGLLGPADRRRRLMEDLGEPGLRLEGRLHGPAGFDIGADGPASIALSILAEMHARIRRHRL
ncbi:MAG: XdhC family protein [Woeseia sp.]